MHLLSPPLITKRDSPISSTSPLQLIKVPIANDSLLLNLSMYAAPAHPKNLPEKATTMMAMVYPHALPSFKSPRSVLSPERTKYYQGQVEPDGRVWGISLSLVESGGTTRVSRKLGLRWVKRSTR